METEISIEPVWGKFRQDRKGVVVRFFYPKLKDKTYIMESSPNMAGKVFRWLPTYPQLEEIQKMLQEVEKLNELYSEKPVTSISSGTDFIYKISPKIKQEHQK